MSAVNAATSVQLERLLPASCEQVFAAWTNAELLNSWFGPEGFTVIHCEINVKVGEGYRIDIQSPNGAIISHYGKYLLVEPASALVFSWMLDDQDCDGSKGHCVETLVSIELEAVTANSCKLFLHHEQLPNKAACDGHRFGWTGSLDSLQQLLQARRDCE